MTTALWRVKHDKRQFSTNPLWFSILYTRLQLKLMVLDKKKVSSVWPQWDCDKSMKSPQGKIGYTITACYTDKQSFATDAELKGAGLVLSSC